MVDPSHYIATARHIWQQADLTIDPEPDCVVVNHEPDRHGAWVSARVFVHDDELIPQPGPTYIVWICEPSDWRWRPDLTFCCDDDPDGKGARHSAHEYARYLRNTYHCSYVAVRLGTKAPRPVRHELP